MNGVFSAPLHGFQLVEHVLNISCNNHHFSFEHTFFYGDSTIPGRVRRIHGTRLVVPEGDPVEGTVQFRGAVEMSSRSGELGARSTSSHDEELPDGLFVLTSM